MKKLNNEALNVTSDQLSKDASLKSYLKSPDGQKTNVNIVDKNKALNSASATNSTSPTTTTLEEDAIPEPQVRLKKISKLMDKNGEVSKPFVINGKTYQMVRAMQPDRQVVQGVHSIDENDEEGFPIIHSVDYFDRTIATPARDAEELTEENPNQNDDAKAIDYLNVDDMAGSRHFFVNKNTGEVVAKFPNTRDMIKSGIKLSEDEDYMDAKALRRHRLRKMLDSGNQVEEDVNLGKLQQDVKRLSKLIKDKFVIALDKINTPIEQSQFLVAMANEIGVPFAKLTSIINSFKDISKDQNDDTPVINMTTDSSNTEMKSVAESRVITKNELLESIKPVSKKIKVKDIKNGRL